MFIAFEADEQPAEGYPVFQTSFIIARSAQQLYITAYTNHAYMTHLSELHQAVCILGIGCTGCVALLSLRRLGKGQFSVQCSNDLNFGVHGST